MPTLEAVKEDRQKFNARDTYERFNTYCEAHKIEPTEDALATWDEKHNGFAIRDNYGSKSDIYALGLRTLYRRFLDNNCLRIPTGRPVSLPSGKTYQPTVRDRRSAGGSVTHLRGVTTAQLNVIREQLRADLRSLLRVQKFLSLPAGEIREIVQEVLDELGQ